MYISANILILQRVLGWIWRETEYSSVLNLVWAALKRIHKAQGATFDNGIVDFEHEFGSGLVYDALSRF